MILIRAIAFLLHFTLVPAAMGRLITYRIKVPEHRSPIVTYVVGLFGNLGIFFIMCAAFTWYQNYTMVQVVITGGFSSLVRTYSAAAVAIVLLWIVLDFKNRKKYIDFCQGKIEGLIKEIKADKLVLVYLVIFLAALLVQLYFAFAYEVNEWSYDDFDYVVQSNDDISFDMLSNVSITTGENPFTEPKRAATAWPAYIAYLAQVSGFEVTTVCHTILPVVLILIAYGIYYLMAKSMFDRFDNRLIFMIILSAVFMFGLYSHYSLTFRLLCTIWQGKAVLCAMVLPFLFVYLPKVLKEKTDFAVMLPIFAVSLGASSLTTMSMLLLGLEFILMWVTMTIYKRKPASIAYLFAGIMGPAMQFGFYVLITLLLKEQLTPGKIWFG